MLLQKAMTPINRVLGCAGCRLYPSSHPVLNLFDNIQAFVLIICHFYCIYNHFPLSLYQWDLAENTGILLQQSFGILFIIIMRYNRTKLRNLLKSLERPLKVDDNRQLLNYSIILSIPHWTFLSTFIAINTYLLLKYNVEVVSDVIY